MRNTMKMIIYFVRKSKSRKIRMPAQNMAKISKIHILKEKSLFVSNLQHYLIKCHPLINATLH